MRFSVGTILAIVVLLLVAGFVAHLLAWALWPLIKVLIVVALILVIVRLVQGRKLF